jgi:hypothetical protein
VEYYLVESEYPENSTDITPSENSGEMPVKIYGIELVKKQNNHIIDSKIIKDYSICRSVTEKSLARLVSSSVTPMCLEYILDDMLGEMSGI